MVFTAKLFPGEKAFGVRDGETLLDAAIRQKINLPHSCRGGSCRSCLARLVEGEVTYDGGVPAALSAAEVDSGYILMCRARPVDHLVVEAREIDTPDGVRIVRLPCRVEGVEKLCHDVIALYLKLPPVAPLQFLAGQYVDLITRDGMRRSFSLANPPHDNSLLVLHIRKVPGGAFTDMVFAGLPLKTLFRIEGPLGGFYLREDSDRPVIMMAGGTGIAPVRSMLLHAFESGFDRPIQLYWGVRSERDLYERDLIQSLAADNENLSYVAVLSEPDLGWSGRNGFVHTAVLEDHPDLSSYTIYASGPPPMVDGAIDQFPKHGLDPLHLHFDSFEFAPEVQQAIRDSQSA